MRSLLWSSRAFRAAPLALALLFCDQQQAKADTSEPAANAAENQNQKRAEELYKEGAQLLSAGHYWEAEARFQESLKLLKGRGTLLNLAICHENLGRLATAHGELKLLEEQALAAGDTTRLKVAREHLAWIEPQLSYLSVALSADAQLPGIQVELDGQVVPTLGVPFPVDPGRHQLRASAPGKKDYNLDLVFEIGNEPRSVTIPSLADVDVVAVVGPPLPELPKTAKPAVERPPDHPPKADYRAVYIAGAATVTLTVGAIASAFLYYDRRAAYHESISNPDAIDETEASERHASAKRMAWINGSLVVAAGIGAAVTGVLWYRAARPSKARVAEGVWVAPAMVGTGAGLRAGASF